MAGAAVMYLVCRECGAEVDRIEYDDQPSPAVAAVQGALSVSEDEARRMVKRANPGAELSNHEQAKALA